MHPVLFLRRPLARRAVATQVNALDAFGAIAVRHPARLGDVTEAAEERLDHASPALRVRTRAVLARLDPTT